MLQLIVYSLLIFLTLLAICDIIGSCMEDEATKKRFRIMSAPFQFVKNRVKGMRTLKEESAGTDSNEQTKPYTISETV